MKMIDVPHNDNIFSFSSLEEEEKDNPHQAERRKVQQTSDLIIH